MGRIGLEDIRADREIMPTASTRTPFVPTAVEIDTAVRSAGPFGRSLLSPQAPRHEHPARSSGERQGFPAPLL